MPSTQELSPPFTPPEAAEVGEVTKRATAFMTDHGSIYTYDNEGKTTRFKTAAGEQEAQQDITVFVNLDVQEEQDYLQAYRVKDPAHKRKVYVLERQTDDSGKIVRDVSEVVNPDGIYLAIFEDGQIAKTNKASLEPAIGANVFDTRHFEQDGQMMTERHLGNKVTEIAYKN